MKHRRTTPRITGPVGSGLNAHMDDQVIPLQQLRTVRRCQRKTGALMDELNEVAKQLATIMVRLPVGSRECLELREAVVVLDTMLIDGDKVSGWLDDWILARQAQEQAKGERP